MKPFLTLAFESSCDDTSVAIVDDTGRVYGVVGQNQDDIHKDYGGVIPELACRNHTMRILPLLEDCFKKSGLTWSDIGGISVTSHPGLMGALMVAVTTAKTLAWVKGLPLLGVNHLEGHLHASFLRDETYTPPFELSYPFIGLVVSGGHTSLYLAQEMGRYEVLGKTLDDAAGEAFDKFGKLMGLGYPAGALVDKLAQKGNVSAFDFPRALPQKTNFNFSFSGLKTSAKLAMEKISDENFESQQADLCAAYQEAIVDVLVQKTWAAMQAQNISKLVVTGGVACNSRLRSRFADLAREKSFQLAIPPPRYCTDNAAMIGFVGAKRLVLGERSGLNLRADSFMKVAKL